MRTVAPEYDVLGAFCRRPPNPIDGHQRRGNGNCRNRRSSQKLTQTESTACQAPLEESRPVAMLLYCMSDIYPGSPEWRWIFSARIRLNGHVIPSMTLNGGQNGELEVPRCEWKEELPPDPGIGWLRLRHTGPCGTSRMPQQCRPFRDVCLGSFLQWPP